jgi:predicted membrane-bound spermidine synthase
MSLPSFEEAHVGLREVDEAPEELRGSRFGLLGLMFAMSGFAALIYQVAWQRILAFHSGVGIYSVAIIVSSFMAGMGLGSYMGGRLSSRLATGAALRIFALLELGIGLFALLSCTLYYDVLYLELSEFYQSAWSAGLLHFLALVVPTTLMGMSLPFLAQAAVAHSETASRTIGILYGLNVVGAALGAISTPWLLIRFLGIEGAVAVGAACNLAAGAIVLVLALGSSARAAPDSATRLVTPAAGTEGQEPAGQQPFSLWVVLYGASGFCALALEIIWFRVIDVAVKSTAFTFGSVLGVYLLGLAAGSLWAGQFAPRLTRPLHTFLTAQCLLLGYSAAALLALVHLPVDLPVYGQWFSYWAGSEPTSFGAGEDLRLTASLYVLLPLFLYAPPTFLMGVSFAVLQRAVQNDRQTSGLKVGLLQAANIVGNVAGSLLIGLVLLSWLGTMGAFRVVVGFGIVFAAVGIRYYGYRWWFGALGAAILVLLVALPSGDSLWRRLHGLTFAPGLFEEDGSGVAAITGDGLRSRLSVNGKGHSWLPYGGIHSVIGALPAALHAKPEEVAIIGLGSGDTAWAASFRDTTRATTVFEIIAPETRLLERFADSRAGLKLNRFLADPRIKVAVADGRNALLKEPKRYDLIEADALRPESAYAGNLYSQEFFELAASRLKEGGLMCTWAPTPRIIRSFAAAFPHVLFFGGEILVGSNQPIEVDPAQWLERLSQPSANSYLGENLTRRIHRHLATVRRVYSEVADSGSTNRDLFPRDEFRTP